MEKSRGLTEKSVYREERLQIEISPDKSGAVATLIKGQCESRIWILFEIFKYCLILLDWEINWGINFALG